MPRFPRYSLRWLMLLASVCCVVVGWISATARQRAREVAALDEIERLTTPTDDEWLTRVRYMIARHDSRPVCVNGYGGTASQRRPGPQWLGDILANCDQGATLRVKELSLTAANVGDELIPHLAQFKSLKRLDIHNSRLTPAGEGRLRSLLPGTTIVLNVGRQE